MITRFFLIRFVERPTWARAFVLYRDATFREYTRSARAYYAGERFTFKTEKQELEKATACRRKAEARSPS